MVHRQGGGGGSWGWGREVVGAAENATRPGACMCVGVGGGGA